MTDSAAASFVLAVRDLKVEFRTAAATTVAVCGVSFDILSGQTVALVGESGSGKSVTSLSLLRLIRPPGFITNGSAVLRTSAGNSVDLLSVPEPQMRKLRGSALAMIFQEPMTALNPVLTVGEQISEALLLHRGSLTSKQQFERAVELLRRVGIPQPDKRAREYPHTLSGGMRQRVAIAMAISCQPTLLIADEPTTALDVTIQAQILQLLRSLQEESGMSMLFITHDLRVVQSIADRVVVMKDGLVVEQGCTADVFSRPQHPYSVKLLSSMPVHA